jgi:hypothetical protein
MQSKHEGEGGGLVASVHPLTPLRVTFGKIIILPFDSRVTPNTFALFTCGWVVFKVVVGESDYEIWKQDAKGAEKVQRTRS